VQNYETTQGEIRPPSIAKDGYVGGGGCSVPSKDAPGAALANGCGASYCANIFCCPNVRRIVVSILGAASAAQSAIATRAVLR
jgi:hypothetical protein